MPRKPKARMLWGQISTSPKVNALSLKAALLYTWLIAHCDDQGRMLVDAKAIKGAVCPMRDDIEEEEVLDLLQEMQGQGLIDRYLVTLRIGGTVKRVPVLQMLDWWEYQSQLSHPRPSQYPPMEGWTDRIGKPQARDEEGRFMGTG